MLSTCWSGNPAAPLRKALIDSGLGEGMTGGGIADGMRQPYGDLRPEGHRPADAGDKVEALILSTLEQLADDGH